MIRDDIQAKWKQTTGEICNQVEDEVRRADLLHGESYASLHEGYAVLLEEVDELWDQVKKSQGARDSKNIFLECIQIAAVAIRISRSYAPNPGE
jgi:NTP pyrophosphatase (non-canonical NTP hydrolase)